MSLDQTNIVDAVGIENASGSVVLCILDSWGWDDEQRHLQALQEKINAYFGFIESGEIFESYPKAAARNVVIEIINKSPVPESVTWFYEKAAACAKELQVELRSKHIP